ncbi:hypothetical protein AB0H49_25520 [Nocardia sp. NPDC050713]
MQEIADQADVADSAVGTFVSASANPVDPPDLTSTFVQVPSCRS